MILNINKTTIKYKYTEHYVIKFVIDLRQVGGFLRFPPRHDIPDILLKVVLNTINQPTIKLK